MGSLLCACGDEELLKLDKLDGVENWTPEFDLQVAYAEYSVWGLIRQESGAGAEIIRDDANDRLIIRHQENDIYTLNIMDELTPPAVLAEIDVNFTLPPALVGFTVPGPTPLDFSKSDQVGVDFQEGELQELTASMTMNYTVIGVSEYTATITLNNVKENGAVISKVLSGPSGAITLTDAVFDFTATPNSLDYTLELEVPVGAMVNSSQLQISFTFENITFTEIVGKINEKTFSIDPGSFDMNVDFWDKFEGNFAFTTPRVGLIVEKTGLEFPFDMAMDFTAYDGEGGSAHASLSSPQKSGDTLWYGAADIANLLSLPPKDRIDYAGDVTLNPGGTGEILVRHDGTATVSAIIEIPLELQVDDLTFNDTIDVGKIDQDIVDKILEAQLRILTENHIPLELGNGDLILLDEGYNPIDAIEVDSSFIKAPVVNAMGEVTAPQMSTCRIKLSRENIDNLVRTEYFLLSVTASTAKNSGGAQVPVKIKPDATLKLSVGVEAKLDITDL